MLPAQTLRALDAREGSPMLGTRIADALTLAVESVGTLVQTGPARYLVRVAAKRYAARFGVLDVATLSSEFRAFALADAVSALLGCSVEVLDVQTGRVLRSATCYTFPATVAPSYRRRFKAAAVRA